MHITDINGLLVKPSKNSITVKDEQGKTCGVVTNVCPFLSLQANKQINYSKLLRSAGVWGHSDGFIKYTYIIDNSIYLLRNMNSYDYYTDEKKATSNAFYDKVASLGITVINVRFIA